MLNKRNKTQVDSELQGIQLTQMHKDAVLNFLSWLKCIGK